MSRHLTSEQVSAQVLGEQSPEAEQHLAACADCRSEVGQLQDALGSFRTSVNHWAGASLRPDPPDVVRAQSSRAASFLNRLVLASVAVVVILAVFLSLGWRRGGTHRRASEAADAALLKLVNDSVSRTVPGPMEPLMRLVSWDGNPDVHLGRPAQVQKQ